MTTFLMEQASERTDVDKRVSILMARPNDRSLSARALAAYRAGVEGGHIAVGIVRTKNLLFMAAGIAYYAFISLLPFLVLLVTAISIIGGESLALGLLGVTGIVLTPPAESLITTAVRETVQDLHLSVITGLVFLWGTLRIFRGLDVAFSAIYGKHGSKSTVTQLRDAFVVTLAISAALTGATLLGLGSLFSAPSGLLRFRPVLFVGLFLMFVPVYYLFPDTDDSVWRTIPGAVVAASGWALFDVLFQVYLLVIPQTTTYGVLGTVLIVLIWLYLGGFSLLLGAVLNAVLAGHDLTDTDIGETEV